MQCIDVYWNTIEANIEMSDEVSHSVFTLQATEYYYYCAEKAAWAINWLDLAWVFGISINLHQLFHSDDRRFTHISTIDVCLVWNCGFKYIQLQSRFVYPFQRIRVLPRWSLCVRSFHFSGIFNIKIIGLYCGIRVRVLRITVVYWSA